MATRARSPATRAPAASRREASPQQLAERVKELEGAEKEAKKAQAKEQKQRQRELADAKKKIAKELQAASRMVQKGEREANRLTTKADQVEKQAEQAKAKAARQQQMVDESLGRIHAKRHGLESTLHEKMSGIGEARGRLAHAAFAAKMLEAGVVVPIDGTADYDAASPAARRPRPRRVAANGEVLEAEEGDEEAEEDRVVDGELVRALREENRSLRERLRDMEAELARLRPEGGEAPAEDPAAGHAAEDPVIERGWAEDPVIELDRTQASAPAEEAPLQCSSTPLWAAPLASGGLSASASAPALHLAPRPRAGSFAAPGGPRLVAASAGPSSAGVSGAAACAGAGPAGAGVLAASGHLGGMLPQFGAYAGAGLPGAGVGGGPAQQHQRMLPPGAAPRAAQPAVILAKDGAPAASLLASLRSLATPAKALAKDSVPMEPVAVQAAPVQLLRSACVV